MTLSLSRTNNSKTKLNVTSSYGPTTYTIEEDISSLRHFWSYLGKTLEQMEKDIASEMELTVERMED